MRSSSSSSGLDKLLPDLVSHRGAQDDDDDDDDEEVGRIVYRASFSEIEDEFVNYDSLHWILMSLLLVLAWGVGLLMLLYIPMRRYITRRDLRSRKLYVTDNAVVFKTARPAWFPCFGINRRERYVRLPLVTDVVIEQGCLESCYGISSLRIEAAGQHRPSPNSEIQIRGLANPALFRKVVLAVAAGIRAEKPVEGVENLRSKEILVESFSPPRSDWAWRQGAGLTSWQMDFSSTSSAPAAHRHFVTGEMIFQKLEGIENALKRIQVLVEDR